MKRQRESDPRAVAFPGKNWQFRGAEANCCRNRKLANPAGLDWIHCGCTNKFPAWRLFMRLLRVCPKIAHYITESLAKGQQ